MDQNENGFDTRPLMARDGIQQSKVKGHEKAKSWRREEDEMRLGETTASLAEPESNKTRLTLCRDAISQMMKVEICVMRCF